jgi:hypothetical protein
MQGKGTPLYGVAFCTLGPLLVNNLPLPAVPLRCTIKVAYQAADAGHPEDRGESKLAAEPASLADMFIFLSGCARRKLT